MSTHNANSRNFGIVVHQLKFDEQTVYELRHWNDHFVIMLAVEFAFLGNLNNALDSAANAHVCDQTSLYLLGIQPQLLQSGILQHQTSSTLFPFTASCHARLLNRELHQLKFVWVHISLTKQIVGRKLPYVNPSRGSAELTTISHRTCVGRRFDGSRFHLVKRVDNEIGAFLDGESRRIQEQIIAQRIGEILAEVIQDEP